VTNWNARVEVNFETGGYALDDPKAWNRPGDQLLGSVHPEAAGPPCPRCARGRCMRTRQDGPECRLAWEQLDAMLDDAINAMAEG
jgi:hypothetical protein